MKPIYLSRALLRRFVSIDGSLEIRLAHAWAEDHPREADEFAYHPDKRRVDATKHGEVLHSFGRGVATRTRTRPKFSLEKKS